MHYHTVKTIHRNKNTIIEKCSKCNYKLQSPLNQITPNYLKAHRADYLQINHPDFIKVYGIKTYKKNIKIHKQIQEQEKAKQDLENFIAEQRATSPHRQLFDLFTNSLTV